MSEPTASNVPASPPFRGNALDRLLWKRLKIPRVLVHSALSGAKVALSPVQVVRRRHAGGRLQGAQGVGEVSQSGGYLRFGPRQLPDAGSIAAYCARLFNDKRDEPDLERYLLNRNKRFLLHVLHGQAFCQHPELIRFMISRPVLDTVTRYLGTVPLLAGAALWWSPPNDTARHSQLYHTDNEDWRQIKLFVNVLETTKESGPFTFLPADESTRVVRSLRYARGRIDDARVDQVIGTGREIVLTGPPASGAFVDTARCLHYGSRGNARDRVVLMVQFLRYHSPTGSNTHFYVPEGIPGIDPDPVQRLALGWR